MNLRKNLSILIFLFCIPVCFYASEIRYTGKYIPIDSLSQNDCFRFVCLDLKSKKINLNIENQARTFAQENYLDSTQTFFEQSLMCKLEEEYILLRISELGRVENDSIYVSAAYQKFNKKGNIGKVVKIDDLAISKSELFGVMISPPIKEIKRKRNIYYWFTGTLAATITTLSIVFGQ